MNIAVAGIGYAGLANAVLLVQQTMWPGGGSMGFGPVSDLTDLKASCGLIAANCLYPELDDVWDKIYSRDLYLRDLQSKGWQDGYVLENEAQQGN